jgi:phenylalanyl-tRNA synthetase beta chain
VAMKNYLHPIKMPNITVVRDHLFEAIGHSYTEKEFDELCFEFGVEVDDVLTENVEVRKFPTFQPDYLLFV